jgi:hypothetical protein
VVLELVGSAKEWMEAAWEQMVAVVEVVGVYLYL